MAFDIRNLIRPVAPGLPGAVNPLAFIGAGMATGDMGAQLMRMGQLQQAGQQLAMQQAGMLADAQKRQQALKQQQAMAAIAPGVAKELYPGSASMQAMLAANPQLMADLVKTRAERQMSAAPAGLMTREELNKEFDLSDYTPESVQAVMSGGATTGGYDPSGLVKRTPTYGLTEETSLRKEAGQQINPIRTAVSQGKQLERMLEREGPFSDVASVYSLIRFLDPGSVVREGEIGIVSAAQGLWNQMQGMLKQAQGQGFLTDPMREDMRGMIGELMNLYRQQYDNFTEYYGDLAGQYPGISARRVVGAPINFPDLGGASVETGGSTDTFDLPGGGTAQILRIEKVAD